MYLGSFVIHHIDSHLVIIKMFCSVVICAPSISRISVLILVGIYVSYSSDESQLEQQTTFVSVSI